MKHKYYNIYSKTNDCMNLLIQPITSDAVNKSALILFDEEDYDKIKNYSWRLNEKGYVITSINKHKVRLHNLILNRDTSDPKIVCDHINRNKLDNRKENLRIVTQKENNLNRTINKTKSKHCCKTGDRWKAYTNINGKYKHLGYFNTMEEAQQAYNHYRENR